MAIIMVSASQMTAQTFKGSVVDLENLPLPNAAVQWEGTNIGVMADDSGHFDIALPPDTSLALYHIKITFGGATEVYEIDDLFSEWIFTMAVLVELQEVSVYDVTTGAYISRLQPIKTEIINSNELRKAACCDLAGCFETQSTVQPQVTNVLTNAKELRILGLSGVYNRILIDGLPLIQGLTYTYGLSTLPGSIVDKIWVVKGANSVIHGYEGMVGEITIYPKEGKLAAPLSADLLVNSFAEKHANVSTAFSAGQWNNYLAVHASTPGNRIDRDDDTFMDIPLITRYSMYNKWRFRNENEDGWSSFIGLRYTDEQRVGGQSDFKTNENAGTRIAYGQWINIRQPEVFAKSGYRFNANSKISLFTSAVGQSQQSWYGLLKYDATQLNAYVNLQHEWFIGNRSQHDIKYGASFRHFELNEDITFTEDSIIRSIEGRYSNLENIPGLFAEGIWALVPDTLTLITGVRGDVHNRWGAALTPRFMLRYLPFVNTDIRISAGTGWRTVNLFSENVNLLSTGRELIFRENIQPEKALNTGISITQKFSISTSEFTVTADFYHTSFSNQFFPEYDLSPGEVVISNFTGTSVSNGFQTELIASLRRQIEIRLAYNYLDVYRMAEDRKVPLPYNARHRLLAVFSIHSAEPRWQFDLNLHWYDRQRLPDIYMGGDLVASRVYSLPYEIMSVQYTHTFPRFEVFAGCENLFDFRQYRPIANWQSPFSRAFDTSYVWGPTRGRELYAGLRFRLERD
ncbi:MAG: TonB-dependent receptor plug domain-containing protein [Flavobacteriales bacterium]|nr:TonB-dependent receptor plug domain-containing protein [Flavobacteriales bacterium]